MTPTQDWSRSGLEVGDTSERAVALRRDGRDVRATTRICREQVLRAHAIRTIYHTAVGGTSG